MIVKIHYKAIRHIYLRVKADGFIHVSCHNQTSSELVFQLVERHYQKLQNLLGKNTAADEYSLELNAAEKLQAQLLFQSRLDYWFELHFASRGIAKPALVLRRMTSRWGSYSRKTHRVCLNYSLFRHPPAKLDQVIVHELCHLIHFNHGKDFYALVNRILSN